MSNSQRSVNRIVESLIMRALWQLDFDCVLFVYTRILTDFAVVIYCCSHSRTFSCLKTKSAGIKRAIKMVFNSWKTETSGAWTTDESRRVCLELRCANLFSCPVGHICFFFNCQHEMRVFVCYTVQLVARFWSRNDVTTRSKTRIKNG